MWERSRIARYRREVRALGRAVTDPDDIAIILELEKDFARVKANATRTLLAAGYSEREIARASGRHLKSVQQWLKSHPETQDADTHGSEILATDATHESAED